MDKTVIYLPELMYILQLSPYEQFKIYYTTMKNVWSLMKMSESCYEVITMIISTTPVKVRK